jgi:hypothetical protein
VRAPPPRKAWRLSWNSAGLCGAVAHIEKCGGGLVNPHDEAADIPPTCPLPSLGKVPGNVSISDGSNSPCCSNPWGRQLTAR